MWWSEKSLAPCRKLWEFATICATSRCFSIWGILPGSIKCIPITRSTTCKSARRQGQTQEPAPTRLGIHPIVPGELSWVHKAKHIGLDGSSHHLFKLWALQGGAWQFRKGIFYMHKLVEYGTSVGWCQARLEALAVYGLKLRMEATQQSCYKNLAENLGSAQMARAGAC